MILKHTSGKEIYLDENTEDVVKLKNQLMLLGMNGLAYSEIWNNIAKKIKKLGDEKDIKCLKCKSEDIIMDMENGMMEYYCSKCGYDWKDSGIEVKKLGGENGK